MTDADRAEVQQAIKCLDEVWHVQLQGVPSELLVEELARRKTDPFCGCEYCQAVWDAEMARDVDHLGEAEFRHRLARRGYVVRRDRIPAWYPPMADGDE